jgi:hypothetical protein
MAIVEKPLFSDTAKGKIKNTLTFFKRGEWYHVLNLLSFKDRDTAARLEQKLKFQDGVAAWNALPQADRVPYEQAATWDVPAYNYFLSRFLLGLPPLTAANPSDTVTDETAYGIAKNAGASTDYSRGDHTHGTPAAATVLDKCRIYRNAAYTQTGGTLKVPYDTDDFDTNNISDLANARITPKKAGYYQFNWSVGLLTWPANYWAGCALYKNNAAHSMGVLNSGYPQAGYVALPGSDIAYANGSTDYFEIFTIKYNQGIGLVTGTTYTFFSVVGPF